MHDTSLWAQTLAAAGATQGRFDAGAIVFLQGASCDQVAFVAHGRVEIRSTTPCGRELAIQSVDAGDFFGDVLAFAGGTKYLGNVVAAVSTEVWFLAPYAFVDLLSRHKDLLADYLSILGRKTFAIKQQVKLLSLPDLRSRILFWLAGERDRTGCPTIQIPRSKERLADLLGVERPSLSRELARMKRAGLVTYDRKSIGLLAPGIHE